MATVRIYRPARQDSELKRSVGKKERAVRRRFRARPGRGLMFRRYLQKADSQEPVVVQVQVSSKGKLSRSQLAKVLRGAGSVFDLAGSPEPGLRTRVLAELRRDVQEALAQDGAAVAGDFSRAVLLTQRSTSGHTRKRRHSGDGG